MFQFSIKVSIDNFTLEAEYPFLNVMNFVPHIKIGVLVGQK